MSEQDETPEDNQEPSSESTPDPDDAWSWRQQILWGLAIVGLAQLLSIGWTLVRNPAMTYSAITGEPYDFHHAVKPLELNRIKPEQFDQTTTIGFPVAAGIVISETSLRAYNLGPEISLRGLSEYDYPDDELEIEMWDYRIHSRDRNGQLIEPLLDWLTHRADKLKMLMGSDVELRVIFAVDKRAGFDVHRMAMYTAGQAQHSEFHHVVNSASGRRLMPSNLPQIGAPEVLNGTGSTPSTNETPPDEDAPVIFKHMWKKRQMERAEREKKESAKEQDEATEATETTESGKP